MTTQADKAEEQSLRGTWVVLAMTAISMMVVAYNTTAVITILPNLRADFDLRPTTLQWVMTIYTISSAALVAVLGRLADVLGKMKIFMFGQVVFVIGAIVVIVAGDGLLLLVGRFAQGIGAAASFGTSLGVLSAATPESRRSFVMGIWGAVIALGMSLGPVIGGLFAEFLNWRGIFYLDVTLLVVAFVIALHVLKAGYVPDATSKDVSVDYAGAVLLILLLGPLAFGLTHGQSHGWTAAPTVIALVVAALSAIAFFVVERRSREPLLQLGYFRHPRFLMATIGMLIAGIILFCFFFYFNIFVQSPDTFAMSPVVAGAAILPVTVVMFVFSVTAARALGPYSFRWPIALGMACLAVGFWLLADTSNSSTYSEIWWKLLIVGVGLGLTFPLLPRVGLRILPEEDAGQGSGVINTCLYFGATLGVVTGGIAAIFTIRSAISQVVADLPVGSAKRETLVSALAHGTHAEVDQALAALSPPTTDALREALRAVQDDAFNSAMIAAAAAAVVGVVLAVWLMRGPVPEPQSAASLKLQVPAKS